MQMPTVSARSARTASRLADLATAATSLSWVALALALARAKACARPTGRRSLRPAPSGCSNPAGLCGASSSSCAVTMARNASGPTMPSTTRSSSVTSPIARPPSVTGMRRTPCSCISLATCARSAPMSQVTTSSDMISDRDVAVGSRPWPSTASARSRSVTIPGEPARVAHQHRADMIVGHGAGGLIGLGLAVQGDEFRAAKALKRHGEPPYAASMANEASRYQTAFASNCLDLHQIKASSAPPSPPRDPGLCAGSGRRAAASAGYSR